MISDLIAAYVAWAAAGIVTPLAFVAGWNWFRASVRS